MREAVDRPIMGNGDGTYLHTLPQLDAPWIPYKMLARKYMTPREGAHAPDGEG